MSNINIFIAKSFFLRRENGVTFPILCHFTIDFALNVPFFFVCVVIKGKRAKHGKFINSAIFERAMSTVSPFLIELPFSTHYKNIPCMKYMLICLFKRVLSMTTLFPGSHTPLLRYHTFILFIAAQNHKIIHNTIRYLLSQISSESASPGFPEKSSVIKSVSLNSPFVWLQIKTVDFMPKHIFMLHFVLTIT